LHNGMLRLDGVKMSKSLGNLVLARDLLRRYDGDQLRLYLLGMHYREDGDYREDPLAAQRDRFDRLRTATVAAGSAEVSRDHPVLREFEAAMNDDLDTPAALQVLDRAATRVLDGTAEEGEAEALRAGSAVLGFAYAGAR